MLIAKFLAAIGLLAIAAVIGFLLGRLEDAWLCENAKDELHKQR